MSFELFNFETSQSNNSFALESTKYSEQGNFNLNFQPFSLHEVMTQPVEQPLPQFLSMHPPSYSVTQNLDVFSHDFDQKLPKSLSNAPSKSSIVEIQTRRNQAPKWRQEEDDELIRIMQDKGSKKWKEIALLIAQKTGNAVRQADAVSQRWSRVVNPSINKVPWAPEEIAILKKTLSDCQARQWKQIAEHLPGRTDIQVRYQLIKMKTQLINEGINAELLPQ